MVFYALKYLDTKKKTRLKLLNEDEAKDFLAYSSGQIIGLKKIYIYKKDKYVQSIIKKLQIFTNKKFNLSDTLILLSQSEENEFEKYFFTGLLEHLEKGNTMHTYFVKFNRLFSGFEAEIIKIGEVSNNMPHSLNILQKFYYYKKNLQDKLSKEAAYPLTVLLLSIMAFFIIILFVVPNYREIYSAVYPDIKGFIGIVFSFSQFMRENFFIIILLVGLLVSYFIYKSYRKNKTLEFRFEKLPFFRSISSMITKIEFFYIFKTLIDSGYPMDQILRISSSAIREEKFRSILTDLTMGMNKGDSIFDVLKNSDILTQSEKALINVGQNANDLSQVFEIMINFMEESIEKKMHRIISLFQPIVYLFIGILVVGIILLAFYPMLDILKNIG